MSRVSFFIVTRLTDILAYQLTLHTQCDHCRNTHSARRAQTLLTTMETLHSSKKTYVQPDLDCYRYVLTTMARSRIPTVGGNIPSIFKSMEDRVIFPDTACFDAAIETLANCARHSNSLDSEKYAHAAESMLIRMEREQERSSESIIRLTSVAYTNVIRALEFKNSKAAAERANEILTKLEMDYASGDESMQPIKDSYLGTIHAYGNSNAQYKFITANVVLQRMIAQYSEGNEAAKPDIFCFHAVIRACFRSPTISSSPMQDKKALLLAISTVQSMKNSNVHPTAKSYLLLLQCCSNLLPRGSVEQEKNLQSIFRSCRKSGLVNKYVLAEFRSTVSTDTYHKEVVQDAPYFNCVKSLPETWTRNLGYRPRIRTAEHGIHKRNPIISVDAKVIASTASSDYRMRRRWSKTNQKLLRGGRS